MKKIALLLVFVFVLSAQIAHAADQGVQIIERRSQGETMVDMKPNVPVVIPNYGTVTILSGEFYDLIRHDYIRNWLKSQAKTTAYKSGPDADYYLLYMDITNMTGMPVDFAKRMSVTVTYMDQFAYKGFVYQCAYELRNAYESHLKTGSNYPFKSAITKAIESLEVGHYVAGCLLPNMAVSDTSGSLQMKIILDGHEIIYNIR